MHTTRKTVTVYLISGPLGVGKSTVSKTLASAMNQCVLIEGDLLLQVYRGETEPPWEERLRLAWLNIAAVTRNFLVNGLDVVIDFVVEDELQWFFDQLSDLDVTLHYVVLHAEPETLNARLHQRGDAQYIDRSLFLRSKLMASPVNELFLLDTDGKKPDELAEEIIKNSRFRIHG
ncbi:AAA domain-containing protein [Paenibacillus sp. BK033]|uniref:AAA family ATPase n=1 Tax=Paenibacillus sp. BK033 TaxID=2512133 RepID=UPI0010525B33|nr:AAA family ATPase [Paenibacillus sp. BK033]TCM87935.1 AAA domain-containing protein [Paenibacillus sp. BK033]